MTGMLDFPCPENGIMANVDRSIALYKHTSLLLDEQLMTLNRDCRLPECEVGCRQALGQPWMMRHHFRAEWSPLEEGMT